VTPLELVPARSISVTVPLKTSPFIESIETMALCPTETERISLSSTLTGMDMVLSGLMLKYWPSVLLSSVRLSSSSAFISLTVPLISE